MGSKVSFWKEGWAGLHLTINPQRSLPPSAKIYRRLLSHGIRLSDREIQSLLAGREAGIAAINNVLRTAAPSLGSKLSLQLSTQLADAIMNQSLKGQLSREAPTGLQGEQRDQALKTLFEQPTPSGATRGPLPLLLQSVPPVGITLTIHF